MVVIGSVFIDSNLKGTREDEVAPAEEKELIKMLNILVLRDGMSNQAGR